MILLGGWVGLTPAHAANIFAACLSSATVGLVCLSFYNATFKFHRSTFSPNFLLPLLSHSSICVPFELICLIRITVNPNLVFATESGLT